MPADALFADFIRRIRAGDAQAAVELVRRFEPVVRLEVRVRLSDPRLGRMLDSMDICQSVLASFFVRAAAGQYELEQRRTWSRAGSLAWHLLPTGPRWPWAIRAAV